MSEPKLPSDDWHWDNDRRCWVFMGLQPSMNPTYRWEIKKDKTIYENDTMMEAIDLACKNMSSFPDAERILQGLDRGKDDK